jgi:hypothetical protein
MLDWQVGGGGLRARMIVEVFFGSMMIFVECVLREAVNNREIKKEGWLIRIWMNGIGLRHLKDSDGIVRIVWCHFQTRVGMHF